MSTSDTPSPQLNGTGVSSVGDAGGTRGGGPGSGGLPGIILAAPAHQSIAPSSVVILILIVVVLAVGPPLIGGFATSGIAGYLIFGLLALSVGLISGYGRLFNLGVGANFGVSAYTVAILSQNGVTNPFVLLGSALLAGLIVGLLFAFYALVSSGTEYLMLTFLTTLAFATIPSAIPGPTGGDNGLAVKGGTAVSFGLNPLEGPGFYWFVLATVLGISLVSWYVLHSQTGMAVQAIGRNPVRAAAMGYNVSGYRVALTLYAGMVASIGGWLYSLQRSFVFERLLGLQNSTDGLVYALIGGVNTIIGPLIGAGVLRYVTESVSRGVTIFGFKIDNAGDIIIGLSLMLVVYLLPEGLLGRFQTLRSVVKKGGAR